MKKIIIGIIISVGILIVITTIFYKVSEEKYASNDSLHGSFSIKNGGIGSGDEPTDFLVSINQRTSNKKIVECAKKNKVSLSKECWVYCFAENKVFKAKKYRKKITVFEDKKVIGEICCEGKKFLIFDRRTYTLNWRGVDFILHKDSQGFIFP